MPKPVSATVEAAFQRRTRKSFYRLLAIRHQHRRRRAGYRTRTLALYEADATTQQQKTVGWVVLKPGGVGAGVDQGYAAPMLGELGDPVTNLEAVIGRVQPDHPRPGLD